MTLKDTLNSLAIGSDALRDLHLTKLQRLVRYANERSPWYARRFADAGVDATNLRSLDEFARYPLFDKHLERESQAESLEKCGHPLGMHLCCDPRSVNRISASSGTTGTPSFQGHTKRDREIILENFGRLAEVTGTRPGDRVMMAGVMSMWVAGIPTVDALLNFGANVIPIGGLVGSERVLEMMELTSPEVVVGTPSFVRRLIEKSGELGTDLTRLGVRKLFVYGEPGGSVPSVVRTLSDGFGGAAVFDMAGGTGCLNPIFVSSEAQSGLHFIAPDYAYIEMYDRQSQEVIPMEEGAIGEFVYTGLDRECGPLIRFADGDLIKVTFKPCQSGIPGMRIQILGRVDDMLLVKGVNVFPSAVRDVIAEFTSDVTGSMRIVRPSSGAVVDPPVHIKVECRGSPDDAQREALAEKIRARLKAKLRFDSRPELFAEGLLPVKYGRTGKTQLIEIDDRSL